MEVHERDGGREVRGKMEGGGFMEGMEGGRFVGEIKGGRFTGGDRGMVRGS